ncbi:MAG: hypothetical protein MI784_11550 [Cytophagales bacterium]|nr:hypothetical protein [Cytophagales bacterium]
MITAELLDQLITDGQLNDFLQQIQKQRIEKTLDAELKALLGYEKHQARMLGTNIQAKK